MKAERLESLSDEIVSRLSETINDAGYVRSYIASGIAELWRIDNDSYAVIVFDRPGSTVWILCYAGKDVLEFVRRLKIGSKRDGFKRIVFATHKPAVVRMMRKAGFSSIMQLCEVPL